MIEEPVKLLQTVGTISKKEARMACRLIIIIQPLISTKS